MISDISGALINSSGHFYCSIGPYEANIGWHINTVVGTVANSDLQRVGWCLVPLSLLWLFAGPFLNEFIRKLRE